MSALERAAMNANGSVQRSAWSPLRHRTFRGVWVSASAVHMATWLQTVGAASLMAALTPSPLMVALVQTASSLPSVLFGLPAGVIADIVDRRRLMVFTQLWQLAAAVALCATAFLGVIGPWGLLALTAIAGLGYALQAPALQSVLGEVVPREEVPAGLALASVSFNVSRVAGPALAGILVAWVGAGAVYAAVAACFVLVLAFLLRWSGIRRASTLPPERLWSAMRSGMRFVRHSPVFLIQLGHTFAVILAGSAIWALLPVVARDQLGFGPGGYGLLLGCFGIGGLIGVFMLPGLRARHALNVLVAIAALVFALVTLMAAWISSVALLIPAFVVGGAVWLAGTSTIHASVQTTLPLWVRARGLSVYILAYYLSMAGGAALWGAIAAHAGTASALTLSAIATLAGAIWAWRHPLPFGGEGEVAAHAARGSPLIEADVELEEGPVLVQHVYRVRNEAVDAFLAEVRALGVARRRNGAAFWRVYRDLAEHGVFVERYMVDSWAELLRSRERATMADLACEHAMRAHLQPSAEVIVRHYVAQGLPEQ